MRVLWVCVFLAGCTPSSPIPPVPSPAQEVADASTPCTTIEALMDGTKAWSTPFHEGEAKQWFCDPPCRCVEP